ncbi:MAG: hypothetical protein DHS20C05_00870 [Hyphococcus sp.]|nr:MAG: hypothetical protein DHS20C05_00870 [Marinicaulis sp.]
MTIKSIIAPLVSAFYCVAVLPGCATAEENAAISPATLEAMAFLEGHWRGGDDFVFEETWSAPEGGVITAMARGVSGGSLRVLEYVVVAQEEDGLVMRFKHFNADYSTWEDDGKFVSLPLTAWSDNDVTFSADPPSLTVKSIRYWMPTENSLQADVVLIEDGEEGGFSLNFERVE